MTKYKSSKFWFSSLSWVTFPLNYSVSSRIIYWWFYKGAWIETLKPLPYFLFSSSGVAMITNLPLMRIPIREQSDSASFIAWVVNTIDVLRVLVDSDKVFQRNLLEMGSTPEEGSSKNMIEGFPNIAILTHNFLLFPPLNTPAFTFTYGPKDMRS